MLIIYHDNQRDQRAHRGAYAFAFSTVAGPHFHLRSYFTNLIDYRL